MSRIPIVVATLIAIHAPAFANDNDTRAEAESTNLLATTHFEASAGMLLPMNTNGGPSLHATAGLQVGAVRFATEYSNYRVDATAMNWLAWDSSYGQAQRFAASIRYRLSHDAGIGGFGGYAEVGGGGTTVQWMKGDRSQHKSYHFGFGMESIIGTRKGMGFDIGFRYVRDDDPQREISSYFITLSGIVAGRVVD